MTDRDAGGLDSGLVDSGADAGSPPVMCPALAWVSDPASLVNPLLGTTGGGNTFPGAAYPFGMLQFSPDTSPDRTAGSGYEYNDTQLRGFSLTHLSGPGCPAMGDFPVLPMTGGLPPGDVGDIVEKFTHDKEVAQAGYYSVTLGSPTIETEITAGLHSSMARFTFPATNNANLLIKVHDSEAGSTSSGATVIGKNEVGGSTSTGSGICYTGNGYKVYFDMVFDQPFTASQILGDKASPTGIFLTFDTTKTPVIQAKVSISYVSMDKAHANWTADNPGWDFDALRTKAHGAWNQLLGRAQIVGGTHARQELFYTSLYHSLLHPNVFSDADGQYMGFDNQVHTLANGQTDQYANFSGWDIYRSQVQLSALLAPQQMSDAAQSMVNDAAQNKGQLPKWALANTESYAMLGDPAQAMLAEYYAFGAKQFDTAAALEYMLQEATAPSDIRPGQSQYLSMGYTPDDGNYGCCHFYASVSTTLEYAQADFALSQFASALGDTATAARMLAQAQNWKNLFDPATGYLAPKLADGSFVTGIDAMSQQGYAEGSAAQYQWEQPFNRAALITLLGGASAVNAMLAKYFTQIDALDWSAPYACFSNEQDMGQQFWPNYTGQPWVTQNIVNQIRSKIFKDAPNFMDGNDDLGAESALLAWSMLGLFPDQPGSGMLSINGPEFSDACLHLASGNALVIHADSASTSNPYIQSAEWNGEVSTKLYLEPSVMESGGTLSFKMGSSPNMAWGTRAADAPPSFGATTSGFNSIGVSADSNTAAANFDGAGSSYSAEALALVGVSPGANVTAGGLTFTWPNAPSGALDNYQAAGQTVALAAAKKGSKIGFLGSAVGAPAAGATGNAPVTYADKSTQSVPVTFSDWTLGGGSLSPVSGNTIAVTMSYRNTSGGKDSTKTYVFAFVASLSSNQAVVSVTLPSAVNGGSLHVFDVEVQ